MGENNVTRSLETTACKFTANVGDNNYSISIADGKITEVSNWATRGFYDKRNGDSGFSECCHNAIRFIANCNPKELKNIYHALEEGPMKDFCREVQIEKIAELQF